MDNLLGISAAAHKVGCAEGTLRSLDKRGIIKPIRDSAGRRLFSMKDVDAARKYLNLGCALVRDTK